MMSEVIEDGGEEYSEHFEASQSIEMDGAGLDMDNSGALDEDEMKGQDKEIGEESEGYISPRAQQHAEVGSDQRELEAQRERLQQQQEEMEALRQKEIEEEQRPQVPKIETAFSLSRSDSRAPSAANSRQNTPVAAPVPVASSPNSRQASARQPPSPVHAPAISKGDPSLSRANSKLMVLSPNSKKQENMNMITKTYSASSIVTTSSSKAREEREKTAANAAMLSLTSTPFVDMGLSMAMDYTHRIAGIHQENFLAINNGGSVVGGGSYFSQTISRGPSLTLPSGGGGAAARHSQALNVMKNADQQLQTQERQRRDVDAQMMHEMQMKEDRQVQGQGQTREEQEYNHKEEHAAKLRVAQQASLKPVKNIAGFVSAPWETERENTVGLGWQSPMLVATSLVGEMGFETKNKKKVPNSLAKSLDMQLSNKHASDMMALSPAVGTLLQQKVITSPSRNPSRSTRTKKGTLKGATSRRMGSKDDLLMTECLALAATQAELQANIDRQIKEQLMQARLVVQQKLAADQDVERIRERKVIELSEKTQEAKKRVKEALGKKGGLVAQKEADKAAIRDEMLRSMARERAEKQEENTRAARARKEKIKADFKERNEMLETKVFDHLAQVEEAQELRLEEERRKHEVRAIQREQIITQKSVYAAESERKKTEERALKLMEKDESYEQRFEMAKIEHEENVDMRRTKDSLLSFRAEQRRAMLDAKRKAEQELGLIRQTKEAVVATVRRSMDRERPIKLNKLKADQLRASLDAGELNEEPLAPTPGPGEYFKDLQKKINPRGGYLASSRPETLPNENPGPGQYSLDDKKKKALPGAIPFMGRGKTDVDWTIMTASKLPGVGQYELKNKSKSKRSVKLNGKGTSQLDRIITKAKTLPGPGDYNIIEATPKPGSLEDFLLGNCDTYISK